MRYLKYFLIPLFLVITIEIAHAFSFSEYEQEEAKQQTLKEKHVDTSTLIPCEEALKKKKIALIIAEYHANGLLIQRQSNYGELFQVINSRLQRLGLKTYTPEQITKQIAKAEIEAFLNNDLDAAASAANRLGANFFLKGLISTRVQTNPVVHIKEVFVTMSFTLTDDSGKTISHVQISGDSFSGADTLSTVLEMVREKADYIVAKLYTDYCRIGNNTSGSH